MTVEACLLNSCCVCLENNIELDPLSCSERVDTESWLSKLRICVDKIVWSKDHFICRTCSEQLNIVYEFYRLCLLSNEKRAKTQLLEKTKVEDSSAQSIHHGKSTNVSEDNSRALFCRCCDSFCFRNQFELDEHCKEVHVSKTVFLNQCNGNNEQPEIQKKSVNISNLDSVHYEKLKPRRGRKPKIESDKVVKTKVNNKVDIAITQTRRSNRNKNRSHHPLNRLSENATRRTAQFDKEIETKGNSKTEVANIHMENEQPALSVVTQEATVRCKVLRRKCKVQRDYFQSKQGNSNEIANNHLGLKSRCGNYLKTNLEQSNVQIEECSYKDDSHHHEENTAVDEIKEEVKVEVGRETSIIDSDDISIGGVVDHQGTIENGDSSLKLEVVKGSIEVANNDASGSDNSDEASDDGICQDTDEDEADVELKGSPKPKVNKRNNMSFKCDLCGSTFTFCIKFLEHSVMVHNLDEKEVRPYACTHCPKRFNKHSTMKDHAKSHDSDRNEMCSYCGKAFKTKRALTIHEKQHLNLREYQCPHCPKRFNTHKNRNTHIYILHSDPNTWKHACNICEKKFALKTTYIAHMRIHSNFKQFACHLCEKRFTDRTTLRNHLTSHSNVREHKCPECGKEYKNIKYLKVHLAKAHNIGNVKLPVRVKKHFCHMCPKAFCYKNKLLRHIYTHTGERPFPCQVCDKRFTDKSYAVQHMKTMHNIIPDSNHDDVQS